MKLTKHKNGDISLRFRKDQIESLWNMARTARSLFRKHAKQTDDAAIQDAAHAVGDLAMLVMLDLDRVQVNNPIALPESDATS